MTTTAILESATYANRRRKIVAWYRTPDGQRIRQIVSLVGARADGPAETHAPAFIDTDWS